MQLLGSFLNWLESRVEPFTARADYYPPNKFIAYVWYYVKQAKWAFLLLLVFGFFNAAIEATVFSYVGKLVEILPDFSPAKDGGWHGLIAAAGPTLVQMLFITVLARVFVVLVGTVVEEQVIVPGLFTLIRWQSHMHVVRQSLSFFQNDLTGSIAPV